MHVRVQHDGEARVAKALGWFSLALGAAEMAMPDRIADLTGIPEKDGARGTLRAFGAREIASGAAILASRPHPVWVWGRVAGDVLDLAAIGAAMDNEGANRRKLGIATASIAGLLAADVACAVQLTRRRASEPSGETSRAVRVSKTFTISRDPDAVYEAWRALDELRGVLRHLRAPRPQILEDIPGTRITWRSGAKRGARLGGSVSFRPAPGQRGTEVRVEIEYAPFAGRAGRAVASLFRATPEQQIEQDLRRFKQLLETGEIARTSGSASAVQPAHPAPERERALATEGERS